MAYEPTNWTENTPINVENLNKIEQGIKAVEENITTHNPKEVSLSSENDINDYYNTVSDSLGNGVHYTRIVNHNFAHSVLGGGSYFLEGVKTDKDYQWQKITSYSSVKVSSFERVCVGGVWKKWDTPYVAEAGIFDNYSNDQMCKLARPVTRRSVVFVSPRYATDNAIKYRFASAYLQEGEDSFQIMAINESGLAGETVTGLYGSYIVIPITY